MLHLTNLFREVNSEGRFILQSTLLRMWNNAAYLPENPIVYIIFPKSVRIRANFAIFVPYINTVIIHTPNSTYTYG